MTRRGLPIRRQQDLAYWHWVLDQLLWSETLRTVLHEDKFPRSLQQGGKAQGRDG